MSNIELKPCPYCKSERVFINNSPEQKDGLRDYYAICYNCSMAGPEVSNEEGEGTAEEQAAEAWNSLPRHLRWTTETPTEEGWYWNRVAGKETLPVRLYYDSDGEYCYQVAGLPDECWLVESLNAEVGCEWAGPIDEPKGKK